VSASVVIWMGSKSDLEHVSKIAAQLDDLGIAYQRRIASAHKSPRHVLDLIAQYESEPGPMVYITVAGRSNALSGMLDANTTRPVIACPPYSSSFSGADIYSSLRMPSGVVPLVMLDPKGAALAAAKMLALSDPALGERIGAYQRVMTAAVTEADAELQAD